jgi:hypothetical protein
VVAEADLGQGEGGPVEIGVELVGDGDDLGWGGGGGVVLEVDAVGERDRRADVAGRAEAGWAEFLVGVNGAGDLAATVAKRIFGWDRLFWRPWEHGPSKGIDPIFHSGIVGVK